MYASLKREVCCKSHCAANTSCTPHAQGYKCDMRRAEKVFAQNGEKGLIPGESRIRRFQNIEKIRIRFNSRSMYGTLPYHMQLFRVSQR